MIDLLTAVAVSVSMSVGLGATLVAPPGHTNTPKQIDAIEKKVEFSPSDYPHFGVLDLKLTELKKVPVQIVAPGDLNQWFKKYADLYGLDENLLKKIAGCESGFNPGSNSGLYGGMFQFAQDTWISTRNAMGVDSNPDLRFNGEEAIKTAAFKIAHGGKDSWPVCSKG